MKIQKYKGKNEQEIMKQIKEELGSNAIVLNVKTLKSNWLMKLVTKNTVEITAATDMESFEQAATPKQADIMMDQLADKMNNIEQLLTATASKMEQLSYNPVLREEDTTKSKMKSLIYDHLISQEVEKDVALSLLKGTDQLSEDCDIQEIIRIAYDNIAQTIGSPHTINATNNLEGKPNVIFFIGPTGVGKTTSIAKLTADFSLRKQKKVALITADTYRIAAIDQLRTYAEILSVPLKVIYSKSELSEGIKQFSTSELIFVDTAGRSHKNGEQLEELKDMLSMFPDKSVYLVLSATTKFKDLISITNKYADICDEFSIIVTKTDETTSVGTILNLKHHINKPLSYVSFGQNVPDDIEVIDGGKYAKILLGSLGNE